MDLVPSTAYFLPQLEMEFDWQIEMMKPFEYPHSASINPPQDFRPMKQPKRESSPLSSSSFLAYESGNRVISFGAVESEPEPVSGHVDFGGALVPAKPKRIAGGCGGGGFSDIDHVAAERKRREKLTERFVHLSSLLPDLKKLDKASVLAEAARYLKQLQQQVRTLQEQAPKPPMDSNSSSSSTQDFNVINSSDHQTPKIEVKFSEKDVLVRVHCNRKRGLILKVLDDMKKLHLNMINLNAVPFGRSAMDITVIAQMSDEFSTTASDLESLLQRSMKLFCDNS